MISKDIVLRIAELSRLSLTAEEEKAFVTQFSAILKYFEQMEKVDTTGIEPMVTPVEIEDNLRPDEERVWTTGVEVVESAPGKSGRLFKVPPVVG